MGVTENGWRHVDVDVHIRVCVTCANTFTPAVCRPGMLANPLH